MRLVNCTPHDITDVVSGIFFERSGIETRVSVQYEKVGTVYGAPLFISRFGAIEGLPAPQPDTMFIVSEAVQQQVPGRVDLVVPKSPIRDKDGMIQSCVGFVTFLRVPKKS